MNRDQIAIAYIRTGPKADLVLTGKQKLTFPLLDKKASASAADAEGSGSSAIDMTLEGKMAELQRQCFNMILETCKRLSEEHSIVLSAVMSIQVRLVS